MSRTRETMLDPASQALPILENESSEGLRVERALLIMVALSTALAPLNSTMIAVALPNIIQDLNAGVAVAGWLVTGYLIAMASLQPVAGKLGDRLGRRTLMLGGLLYFGLVSLGATLAPNMPLLLFFRIQQGIAGAIVFPNGTALLREVVPSQRRAARFGLIGSITAVAAALGPPLGGLLVGLVGWRAIFLMNVPLLLPALLIGWRYIPRSVTHTRDSRFDIAGAIWMSVVLVGMAWLLTQSRQGETRYLLGGGLLVLFLAILFILFELRHADPVLQPRFFRHRSFAAACAAIAFSNLSMYSTLLALPILLAHQAGWSEVQIGFVLTTQFAMSIVCTPLGGWLADRLGRRWPTFGGLALSTAGMFILTLSIAGAEFSNVSTPTMLGGLVLAGIGLGLSSAGMQTAAVEAVDVREAGVAAGVFSTSRYLGSIVGSSVIAALLNGNTTGDGNYGAVFAMIVAAAAIATLASLGLHDRAQAE
ncbi:MAG: MFS transporter [Caldilineaceae bacterium]|nr:MFS transporter [Caldilineaceae bacterium]